MTKGVGVSDLGVVLINATDGTPITTGTPVGYVTIDGGSQTAIDGTVVHVGNGQWLFDLTDDEMDGDVINVLITHADAIPVGLTIITQADFAFSPADIGVG